MDILSNFAERLKELISEYGLTQKQLAQVTGITETSISKYVRGEDEPSLKSLIVIANHFKCTTDFLIGKTNESNEKNFSKCPPFAERLKFLMQEKNCSGYRLCKDAEIPEGSFYDWKNGKSEPNLDNLEKLTKYFNCSLDYLLGREV